MDFIAFAHLKCRDDVRALLDLLSQGDPDRIAIEMAYSVLESKEDISMNKIQENSSDLFALIRQREALKVQEQSEALKKTQAELQKLVNGESKLTTAAIENILKLMPKPVLPERKSETEEIPQGKSSARKGKKNSSPSKKPAGGRKRGKEAQKKSNSTSVQSIRSSRSGTSAANPISVED